MKALPNPDDAEVIDDPIEVHARLYVLGIGVDDLKEIAKAGLAGLARCHKTNHPKIAGGFYQWSETVCAAGDRMSNLGWRREDYLNVSTIIRPDEKFAVGFARGNDGTGNSRAEVSTKYPKGKGTKGVVLRNRLNLSLPLDERYVEENKRKVDQSAAKTATYLFLYSKQGNEWRYELSLPKSINKSGFVEEWRTRLILPSIQIDPKPAAKTTPVMPNVPVKRRRAG